MRPGEAVRRAALAAAIVGAAALTLGAQAQSTAIPRGVRPNMPLAELCDAAPAEAPAVALSGARFQWMRGMPPGRSVADIVRTASTNRGAWVAVSPRWLAVHDPSIGRTLRADCETGRVDSFPQPRPITALALSSFGDIAEQVQGGPTLVIARQVSAESGSDAPVTTPDVGGDGPRVLAWSGRRLLVVTRSMTTIVDVARKDSRPPVAIRFRLGSEPFATFVYNGLTYVAGDRCLDVFVGSSLTPRVRGAACLPGPLPADAVFAMSRTSLSLLNSGGDTLTVLPRPTIVHAKIAGTTYDITANLLQLVEQPSIDRVPLSNRAGIAEPIVEATTDWMELVPARFWNLKGGPERLSLATKARGWTGLQRQEDGWAAGKGVAVTWRRGSSFVAPQGRSLSELARLTEQPFDDAVVRRIITENSELAETLEGFVIENGWVPVGALFGADTAAPVPFVTPEALARQLAVTDRLESLSLRRVLLPNGDCRVDGGTRREPTLAASARKGIPLASADEKAPTQTMAKAQDVTIRSCGSASTRVEFAELKDVAVDSPYKQQAVRPLATAIVAIRGLAPEIAASLVRSWLDRVLQTRPALRPLLLPTTSFEMMFVVDAKKPLETVRVKGIQLAYAEAVPAALRGQDACSVVATAFQRRVQHEQRISLESVKFESRALTPPLKIAVAENAVPLLSALFRRDNESVWVEPKELGGFGPVREPLAVDPTTRPTRFLKHGTQVAGILFTSPNAAIRGVLAEVPLVWIDTISSASASIPTFDQLAGRKAIVNVSSRLDSSWSSLSENNKNWAPKLLFVAAAKDVTETEDGPPLTWSVRGNVIGVGVLDDAGALPAGSSYDRDVVDLVAPGAGVPTFEDDGKVGCADGTSFATAYVSAVAGIVANSVPGWTVGQIKARLLATADWKPAFSGKVKGGVINARRAIENLDKNVLIVKRGPNPPLQLNVIWKDGAAFDISGTERPNGERVSHRIQWSDVLRWELVTEDNGTESTRVSFLAAGRYVVLEKVAVATTLTLSLEKCFSRDNGQPVPCSGIRAELIKEYVAKRSEALTVDFR